LPTHYGGYQLIHLQQQHKLTKRDHTLGAETHLLKLHSGNELTHRGLWPNLLPIVLAIACGRKWTRSGQIDGSLYLVSVPWVMKRNKYSTTFRTEAVEDAFDGRICFAVSVMMGSIVATFDALVERFRFILVVTVA
jgi:hypothetical protein